MPRRNEVGRTLGGRDKDKMTDCPMVLALTVESKIRNFADTHSHTHTHTHNQTNADTTNNLDCSWVISEQVCAMVVV